MVAIAIKIDTGRLENPEADIRYQLPEHLADVTQGLVSDDGYDYSEDGSLVLFLTGDDESVVDTVLEALCAGLFLGNDLSRAVVVAVDVGPGFSVVYPADHDGEFKLD